MVYIEAFILVVVALFLLNKWLTGKLTSLSERGIPHEKPKIFLGNTDFKTLFGKQSLMHSLINKYRQFKGSKIYGAYNSKDTFIFITDVELIRKICIKDFDHFPNHKSLLTIDNIFSKSLIALKDRQWKEMRNTLTPSFTGSKMRLMFELINECCLEGVKYIEMEMKANGSGELELEMKEYFTKFTNDIIASTAFGIKVNSFTDKNNEFYTTGRELTKFRGWAIVKAILFSIMPKVMKFLRIKAIDETRINYLGSLVFDAIKYREEHNIIRPDMIHLLMEAKRNFEQNKVLNPGDTDEHSHASFNDDDLLAQCILFFLAGFETVSTCLSFTTWELVSNPDIQERLYEEVKEVERDLKGEPLNYDVLMKMKYMDMVISESLRRWPPAIVTERLCALDYKLHDEDGNLIAEIKKDEHILMPIIAYHHDPDYFPDPEKFDPERFSEENKHNFNHSAYMPFGVGPRNCIGNRFALMETKSIIYHLLLKFKLIASEKTCKDMYNSISGFQMMPKELFWLKLIPRDI